MPQAVALVAEGGALGEGVHLVAEEHQECVGASAVPVELQDLRQVAPEAVVLLQEEERLVRRRGRGASDASLGGDRVDAKQLHARQPRRRAIVHRCVLVGGLRVGVERRRVDILQEQRALVERESAPQLLLVHAGGLWIGVIAGEHPVRHEVIDVQVLLLLGCGQRAIVLVERREGGTDHLRELQDLREDGGLPVGVDLGGRSARSLRLPQVDIDRALVVERLQGPAARGGGGRIALGRGACEVCDTARLGDCRVEIIEQVQRVPLGIQDAREDGRR